jgi:hypothetical protein
VRVDYGDRQDATSVSVATAPRAIQMKQTRTDRKQAILRQCQLQPKKHVELPDPNQQTHSFSSIPCPLLDLPAVSILCAN